MYWRKATSMGEAHCFVKTKAGTGYASICGMWLRRDVAGHTKDRPDDVDLCTKCDAEEMKQRVAEEN